MEPSCLLGLANSHLLFELSAEGLQLRFQEPDVATHYAEMGDLLSLNPKTDRLRADAKKNCGFAHADRQFVDGRAGWRIDRRVNKNLVAPVVVLNFKGTAGLTRDTLLELSA
jgi:hypothetical protein